MEHSLSHHVPHVLSPVTEKEENGLCANSEAKVISDDGFDVTAAVRCTEVPLMDTSVGVCATSGVASTSTDTIPE